MLCCMHRQGLEAWHTRSSRLLVPAGGFVGGSLLTCWEASVLQDLSLLSLVAAGCSVFHRSHGQYPDPRWWTAVHVRP